MGANRYSCCKSLDAISQHLWLKNSHNMAVFPHFLAFLLTLLVAMTTFFTITYTERVQTLVTTIGWWYGTDLAISKHLYIWEVGVKNMAI